MNILFLLYYSRQYDKEQKKKHLKSILIKNKSIDFDNPIVYKTAVGVNSIIFVQKCLLYEKGILKKEKLDTFAEKDSKQTFYDSLYKNEYQLNGYINKLKFKLKLITNKKIKRGTCWDLTDLGLREVEKFYLKHQIDYLSEEEPEYFNNVKDKIKKILFSKDKIIIKNKRQLE